MFVDAVDFEAVYTTKFGPVGVLAEVAIQGSRLLLKDMAIYPVDSAKRLPVGVGEMLRIVRLIEAQALSQGFSECTVEAKRLSGAKPGRMMRLTRRLR
jgi:hypothetical protein